MESRPVENVVLPLEEGQLDSASVHREISLDDEDHGIESNYSESGWTTYLDHSLDSLRIQEAVNKYDKLSVDDSLMGNEILIRSSAVLTYEDSASMASDASSGPQLHDAHHDLDLQRIVMDSNPGMTKRRRVEAYHHHLEDPSLLEDTASSPVYTPKSAVTAGEVIMKKNPKPAECGSEIEVDAVNRRLELLQSLLPDGAKICREEALGVAIEYIVGLEQRIKRLEAEGAEDSRSNGKLICGRDHELRSETSALLRRGLCLIPFSMVGNTFKV